MKRYSKTKTRLRHYKRHIEYDSYIYIICGHIYGAPYIIYNIYNIYKYKILYVIVIYAYKFYQILLDTWYHHLMSFHNLLEGV